MIVYDHIFVCVQIRSVVPTLVRLIKTCGEGFSLVVFSVFSSLIPPNIQSYFQWLVADSVRPRRPTTSIVGASGGGGSVAAMIGNGIDITHQKL